ncbi:MAG: hypothetical protein V1799_16530 [bacterium]
MKIDHYVKSAYIQFGFFLASGGMAYGTHKLGRYLMQCSGGG